MRAKDLKDFRKSRKQTQTQMAEEIGVKICTYSNWETGVRAIPKPIIKLVNYMKTDI